MTQRDNCRGLTDRDTSLPILSIRFATDRPFAEIFAKRGVQRSPLGRSVARDRRLEELTDARLPVPVRVSVKRHRHDL